MARPFGCGLTINLGEAWRSHRRIHDTSSAVMGGLVFLVAGWMLIFAGGGFFGCMLIVVFVALRVTAYERKHRHSSRFMALQGVRMMGFIRNWLGRRQSAAEARETSSLAEPTVPETGEGTADVAPALQLALAAFHDEAFSEAFAAAQPYVGDAHARADANRLCALSLSALNRHEEACGYWFALFECEPSAHNALQLATCSVMCDEIDRGEAWLLKFRHLNANTHEMQGVAALVNFISALTQHGTPERAIPHFDDLKDVYAELRTTDPTVLYMNGVPLFSEFLQRSLPILQSAMTPIQIRAWYASLGGMLDDAGHAALDEWLDPPRSS